MGAFPVLNFPEYCFRLRSGSGGYEVWDALRGMWLVLTPEEWVRQHLIRFLSERMGAVPQYVSQEYPVSLGGMSQRPTSWCAAGTGNRACWRSARRRMWRSKRKGWPAMYWPRPYAITALWVRATCCLPTAGGTCVSNGMPGRGVTHRWVISPTCQYFLGLSSWSIYSSCQSDVVLIHSFFSPITRNPLLLNRAWLAMLSAGILQ